MTTPNDRQFFMRFYGQTFENVEKCIAEIKAVRPKILGHSYAPTNISMSGKAPSHCVVLLFADKESCEEMMSAIDCKGIYMKYMNATGVPDKGMEIRKPGDVAMKATPLTLGRKF